MSATTETYRRVVGGPPQPYLSPTYIRQQPTTGVPVDARYSQKTVSETVAEKPKSSSSISGWIIAIVAIVIIIIIIIALFLFFRTPVTNLVTGSGFTYSVQTLTNANQSVTPNSSTLYLVPTTTGTTTTITLNAATNGIGTEVAFKNTGSGTLVISGQGASFNVPAGFTIVLVMTSAGGYTKLFTSS